MSALPLEPLRVSRSSLSLFYIRRRRHASDYGDADRRSYSLEAQRAEIGETFKLKNLTTGHFLATMKHLCTRTRRTPATNGDHERLYQRSRLEARLTSSYSAPKLTSYKGRSTVEELPATGRIMCIAGTPAMRSLNREVRNRIPATIALILALAEHIPLDQVLTINDTHLLRRGLERDDWVLIAEGTDGGPFWLPSILQREVENYWWERRRKTGAHVRLRDPLGHDRMFNRGHGVAITASDVFAVVARAINRSNLP